MATDLKEREKSNSAPTESQSSIDDRFQEMFSTPDNRALGDQIDSIARDRINDQEKNPDTTQADEINNLFNYMKDPNNVSISDTPQSKMKAWLGRNKWSIAGGGGAIIMLGGLFSISMPMKLQGILESVTGTGMTRIEGYIEKRAKKIIIQSLMERFGVGDRNLVKGGSLIKRIAKTMAANKYEERLAKQGLRFIPNIENNKVVSVSLQLVGDNSDEAKKFLGKVFSNADDLEAAIDGAPIAKKIFTNIMKEDLGGWGFLVRGKLVRWMMSYLGVTHFGTKETDKNAPPDDKAKTAGIDDLTDGLEAEGRAIDQTIDVAGSTEQIGAKLDDVADATQKTAAKTSVRDLLNSTVNESKDLIEKATSETITKVITAIGEKIGSQLVKDLASKIGSKAIPVYGWVTLGSMIVVFDHWATKNLENGRLTSAVAMPAAILMGNIYSRWAGIATQAKLGTLDADLFNYYAPYFDGAETSALYTCITKNWETGCDNVNGGPYRKLNQTSNAPLLDLARQLAQLNNTFTIIPISSDYNPVYLLARLVYNIDNAISGWLIDTMLSVIKAQFSLVSFFIPNDAKKAMMDNMDAMVSGMAQTGFSVLLSVFGLDIGPTTGGSKLLDVLVNGSVFTANQFAKTALGLQQITPAVSVEQTQEFMAENRDYTKSKGLLYALFSPETQTSFTSQLVNRIDVGGGPVNFASNIFSSIFGLVQSTPSSLASIVSNKVSAASLSSPEVVVNAEAYGMTDQQLDAPLSKKLLDGTDCTQQDAVQSVASWFGIDPNEGQPFDSCLIDTMTAHYAVLCSDTMDSSITETQECNPDTGGSTTNASTPAAGTCSTGTNLVSNITKGWDRSGNEKAITLCSVPETKMDIIPQWKDPQYEGTSAAGITNIAINSEAAASLLKAAQAAKQDGVTLSASVGYRSLYEQCSIYIRNHSRPSVCPGWITPASSGWSTTVLYSNHMMGYSIDLDTASENWMRKCEKNGLGGVSGRCFGFWDDVYQKEHWDSAHFTYSP